MFSADLHRILVEEVVSTIEASNIAVPNSEHIMQPLFDEFVVRTLAALCPEYNAMLSTMTVTQACRMKSRSVPRQLRFFAVCLQTMMPNSECPDFRFWFDPTSVFVHGSPMVVLTVRHEHARLVLDSISVWPWTNWGDMMPSKSTNTAQLALHARLLRKPRHIRCFLE
jgi:hypothetical protein